MIKWEEANTDTNEAKRKEEERVRKKAEQKEVDKKKRLESFTGAVSAKLKADVLEKAVKLAGELETESAVDLLTQIIVGLCEKTEDTNKGAS